MPSVIELYEKLSSAPDDKTRARIIAEAFETLEERYPRLSDVATRQDLSEAELRLIKEIEQVRSELKETELNLQKEIEQVRAELKETELNLQKEIEQVRAEIKETELNLQKEIEQVRSELKETELNLQKEIEQVRADLRLEIKAVEVRLTQAIHRQTLWVIGSVGAIITLIRLMEWFLEHLPN